MLHSFHAPLFSYRTRFIFHCFFHMFSLCCTFFNFYFFHVNLCYILFIFALLFPCCTFLVLHSFHAALFSYCTVFSCYPLFISLFSCHTIFILFSMSQYFHIAYFVLHYFHDVICSIREFCSVELLPLFHVVCNPVI